jgi:peptide/nickel transport system ATP-binding protein
MSTTLLDVERLAVSFGGTRRTEQRTVVTDVSFQLSPGESVGVVGESGSGKSLTMLSLLGLLPEGAQARAAHVRFNGRELLSLTRAQRGDLLGREIAIVFQDPLTALNPVLTVGRQIMEVIRRHFSVSRAEARRRALELLTQVGIPDPHSRLGQYPHQFSGGMRQRVTIAMALAGEPRVLIADEPTTALDVTVQAEIVGLIQTLQRRSGMSVIWVTHDLALLARVAQRVLVMREGCLVEDAPVEQLFASPRHPYTQALLANLRPEAVGARRPRGYAPAAAAPVVMLAARELTVTYGRTRVRALRGVDLDVYAGETLALVGESGSGKSTLARALVRCLQPDSGSLTYKGTDITAASGPALRRLRRELQIIFQDPFGSLNPRLTVGAAIAEPLVVHKLGRGRELQARVAECLELVGLDAAMASRRPHELSGGQRQRICIARALACRPEFIVADEVLSALDLSLRRQVLELFQQLKEQLALTYVFISHDLGVVRQISDRVAVMYLGRIVELATTAELYQHPRHPYTHALLAAVPIADPVIERSRQYAALPGEPPSPARPPPGCVFHTRCPRATERCRAQAPELAELAPGHSVACHHPY